MTSVVVLFPMVMAFLTVSAGTAVSNDAPGVAHPVTQAQIATTTPT